MIGALVLAAVRTVAIDSLAALGAIVLAGGLIALLLGVALAARWRRAGDQLDRLTDLSDDSADPDWPDIAKTMGRPADTDLSEGNH